MLQNVLETHYSVGSWKEKLIQDIQSIAKIEMSPYGRDKWEEKVSDNGKSINVNFFIDLPFKTDIILEIDRARYSIQFIIHTTS